MVLSMINKSSADKITSQISMSFKNTLGLNKQTAVQRSHVGGLQELSPQERSELTIMRLLRKLKQSKMKCVNHIFLNELNIIPHELKENYINEQISMKVLKSKVI